MEKHSTVCVHKFGGSSLANAERFAALKKLLGTKNEVIVVSATQGTTSSLQSIIDLAAAGKPFSQELAQLEARHLSLAKELLSAKEHQQAALFLQKDFGELKDLFHAIQLGHSYSKELQDLILGYGEPWSAKILTALLSETRSTLYLDASLVLFVYDKAGMICVDWEKSRQALKAFLKDKRYDQLVITGYIASTLDGKRTTLGRNGSDFSSAIFANLFKAKSLTIWTDVDGVYSADPNRVRSAFVLPDLSYKEALELAYFGAKVLHPLTIAPVLADEIPILIKNSLHPKAAGTLISASPKPSEHPVKGLTCIDQVTLINIEGSGMAGVSGIAARVFQILHSEDISVILISQASSEHSICFAIPSHTAHQAVKSLNENLRFEIERHQIEKIHALKDCAILAAVGDGMVGAIGVSGRLFSSLAKADVNVIAISQGSSERNISVVINNKDANKALQAVHAGFYLSRKTISIGLIGPGAIGGALVDQINNSLNELKAKYQVNLNVRGLMNSKKMLLSHEPLDLNDWRQDLEASQDEANLDQFVKHLLADDIPHAVIIDCTANQNIAAHYLDFMRAGLHVITPNKHANAGDYHYYQQLKTLSQEKDRHYLYEGTVCAGLPIINTLQDLIMTGDEINKIEGVVSGTLSFIFSQLSKGKSFSELVYQAKELGYTEPDPREDLSGMDVARKLVCLAREAGHEISLKDVKVHNLVPEELRHCNLEEFLTQLPLYDERINALIEKSKSSQESLAYVGTIHQNGQVDVKIDTFSAKHPFSRLQGTDNMIVFHTQRYQELPLVIQGPGAGAEVTAAGVFADLLRLVSFLG